MRKLKRLRNKLDLANPSPSQLHIEATLLFRLPIDLLLRQTHALQRAAHGNNGTKNMPRDRFFKP
jgi:hypothetical protein